MAGESWTLFGSVSLNEVSLSAPWSTWNLFHNYLQASQSFLLVRQKLWRRQLKHSPNLTEISSWMRSIHWELSIACCDSLLRSPHHCSSLDTERKYAHKTSNNIGNLYFRIWGRFQSFLAKRQVLNCVGTVDEQQKMIKFLNTAIQGYTELYPAIHGYTELYTAVQGYTRLCRAIHSYIRQYTAIQGYTQLYRAIHSFTELYTAIHGYTQLYRAIHSYTGLYTAIQGYTKLYTAVQRYKQLYKAIHSYTENCV